MGYDTQKSEMEPFVVRPFVTFLDSIINAEISNDPVAIGNLSEMGITLGTLVLKKEEGDAIRELKQVKARAQKIVYTHFNNVIQAEKIKNVDAEREKLYQRDIVKDIVSRVIDRYIIRICTFAFRRAPLKMVSVNDDFSGSLFFDIGKAVDDAKSELRDILELYGIGV